MSNLIYNIAVRQKQEIEKNQGKLSVPREKIDNFQRHLSSPLVKVITGPRRAGKSTLCLQGLKELNFAYFNFEDEALPNIADGDEIINALSKAYNPNFNYLFFDEIQNFPNWEQFLNRLHRTGYNLIVTGSNAKMLSTELATALTGRHISIELLPFSFKEFLNNQVPTIEKFMEYLCSGGFPEVVLKKVEYQNYLTMLWDSIILKDITNRRHIRNTTGLSNLLRIYLSAACSRYSVDSLSRQLNGELSAPTVKKFLAYAAEAYLIAELPLFHAKPRVRIKSDRKAYTIDNGYISAHHSGVFDIQSKLLENLIFIDLKRRGLIPNYNLFYYLTKDSHEIDFLIREQHNNIELIQVCLHTQEQKTKEREYRALISAGKELGVKKLTIITLEERKLENIGEHTISVLPAYEWLLF